MPPSFLLDVKLPAGSTSSAAPRREPPLDAAPSQSSHSWTSAARRNREENGPEQLRYIYDKAWTTEENSVSFVDFDMINRYGYERENCD